MADAMVFSNTQRIVIFMDLHPLATISDPSLYFTPIISSLKTLISFPPLSSSLFAFKFFFSSLSPLLSSSKLHPFLGKSAFSLSFHDHTQALSLLSQIPTSLSALYRPDRLSGPPVSPPRAEFAAKSLCQLTHDYPWETPTHDPTNDVVDPLVRRNLVLVFSHAPCSEKHLSTYLDVFPGDVRDGGRVSESLTTSFGPVREAFLRRDIHCCWVDVGCAIECCDKDGIKSGHFRRGISSLGWGFCSIESIVLGSSLLPFGLIYATIAVLPSFLRPTCRDGAVRGHLELRILDVNDNPLVCKCCDLDWVGIRVAPSLFEHGDKGGYFSKLEVGTSRNCKRPWGDGDGVRISVKGLEKIGPNMGGGSPDAIVGCASSERRRKARGGDDGKTFFTDKVFDILLADTDGFSGKNPAPLWHVFLSFLYRGGYCASVSLRDESGDLCVGVLMPFTFMYAFFYVSDDMFRRRASVGRRGELSPPRGGERKAVRKRSYPDSLDWDSFRDEAFKGGRMFLEEVYFAKNGTKSKKLKFLKCWMKQAEREVSGRSCVKNETFCEGMEDGSSPKEFERSYSSIPSSGDDLAARDLEVDGVSRSFSREEESEVFFGGLPEKIRLGLESEGVDLGALAERLVRSSILFLQEKQKNDGNFEKEEPFMGCDKIIVEAMKHLLVETKDLSVKCGISNEFSSPTSPAPNSDLIVRIYELQILFRMEILQSDVAAVFTDSLKPKFVKQICSFLETIQYHLEGGFFGDTRIEDYMEVKIKNRYTHTVGDVVERIYKKMDILVLGEDDEEVASEGERSSRGNEGISRGGGRTSRGGRGEECSGESGNPGTSYGEEYAFRLAEAEEKRERARRSARFTSWMPDLQRVWAPKQLLHTGAAGGRKRKRARGAGRDTVRETPVSRMKRPGPGPGPGSGNVDSVSSVSKALLF